MGSVAVTETYWDVRNLIYKLAWDFRKRYGGEWEDWLQEANLLYFKAYDTFDPTKGATFTSWMSRVIWHGLLSLREKAKNEARLFHYYQGNKFGETGFDTEKLLRELSEDARYVARLALDLPSEGSTKPSIKAMRRSIINFLIDLGWGTQRIVESFKEIKDVLT